jgi:hypothetical protein
MVQGRFRPGWRAGFFIVAEALDFNYAKCEAGLEMDVWMSNQRPNI